VTWVALTPIDSSVAESARMVFVPWAKDAKRRD
jgi:hypothetical protein